MVLGLPLLLVFHANLEQISNDNLNFTDYRLKNVLIVRGKLTEGEGSVPVDLLIKVACFVKDIRKDCFQVKSKFITYH